LLSLHCFYSIKIAVLILQDDEDVSDDDIDELNDNDDDDDDDDEEENNDGGGGGDEDDDEEEEVEEEEEDEVVAAFLSASSDRNRNHPPNLSVGVLIGGFSFHPNTNVIALGLSNGDIAMYAIKMFSYYKIVVMNILNINTFIILIGTSILMK